MYQSSLPVATRRRRGRSRLLVALLFALSLGGQVPLAGQNPVAPVVRSLGGFWNDANQPGNADREHALDLEIDVLYYDSVWHVLWVRGPEGNGSFFPLREHAPLPLSSGQRVRVRGTIIPREGLDPARISVEVLRPEVRSNVDPSTLNLDDLVPQHLTWMGLLGFVDRQTLMDERHLSLDLIVQGQRVITHIMKAPEEPTPNFVGEFVQVTGVFTATSLNDDSGGLGLWVPSLAWAEVAPRYGEERFNAPLQMISEIASLPKDRMTRISGLVFAHDPGRELIVRDETGQVIVRTPQLSRVQVGDVVDVMGYPETQVYPPSLRSAVYRPVSAQAQAARFRPTAERSEELLTRVRLVRQVLRMDQMALAARPMAKLVGAVTYVSIARDYLYLHDSSGGIRVAFDTPVHPSIKPGILLEVGGPAEAGDDAPQVRSVTFDILGEVNLPTPRRVSLEQATSGMETGQWIQLEGYLRAARALDGNRILLSLVTANGEFEALVQASAHPLVEGSTLMITGVCAMEAGSSQHVPTVRLLVSQLNQIVLQAPALAQPFDLPLTAIEHLQHYRPISALHRPIKTRGVVTYHVPGRALWISDGSHVLHALSEADTELLSPGQTVEVVGLPGRIGPQFVLREARFRLVEATRAELAVLDLSTSQVDLSLHGQLVRQVGELVDVANTGRSWILFIRVQNNVIPVKLEAEAGMEASSGQNDFDPTARFEIASTLAVVGLYQTVLDEAGRPVSYELMARSPEDISLVRASPWLNADRAQRAAIVVLLLALAGASWMLVLQRRVARQRKRIQQQVAEESYQRRHYQDLVDQASEFIFTIDLDGNFTSFNKSGERLTGLTREEALTRSVYDLLDERGARRTRTYIERRLNHAKAVTFEHTLRRADGTTLDVEASAGFIHRDGVIIGGYGIMRDISRRKHDEAERRAFDARVQQSKKLEALGTLASGIAHDFNNVLAAIHGAVDVSRLEKSEEQRQELFEQIGIAAERARQLVRQILAFSRNHSSERRPIDLRDTAREVHTMLRASLPASVDLHLDLPAMPLVARANATEIHQIIMNIATNAWHALRDERGRVSILMDPHEVTASDAADVDGLAPGRYARLRIQDDGTGMSPAVIERIFDPFFTTKRDEGGTGLGLAAVHGIVQSNEGFIRVESDPGQGTEFTVLLPLCDEPAEGKDEPQPAELPLGAGQSILLIDDDRMVGLILEKTLRKLHYVPVRFTDPTRAKAYFDEDPARVDAVLSDLSMPELSGRDLAEHMLKVRPELPFLIQSGHIKEHLDEDLLQLGVRHVFGKPVPIQPLAAALDRIFRPGGE